MAGRVCAVDGCSEKHYARTLCKPHYFIAYFDDSLPALTPEELALNEARQAAKDEGKKRCPSCGETKLLGMFTRDDNRPGGWSGWCKKCSTLRNIARNMGITVTEYETLLENQGGVCAICGKTPEKRRLSVDHDHAHCELPGKSCGECVRGFLCDSCNTRLIAGYEVLPPELRDSPILNEYLSRRPILEMRQAGQLEGEEICLVAP